MVMLKHTLHLLLAVGWCLFCGNILVAPLVNGQTGPTTAPSQSSWCVARSDASDQALQTALDYACSAGSDCAPIQQSGLCYLPNTLIAHASYAFNSYYQRKVMAPGSCNFAGTATVAKTDPSYGSCVYPSSLSTAGGAIAPGGNPGGTTNPITNPYLNAPPPPPARFYGNGGGGLTPPGLGLGVPSSQNSIAALRSSVITTTLILLTLWLVIPVVYESK